MEKNTPFTHQEIAKRERRKRKRKRLNGNRNDQTVLVSPNSEIVKQIEQLPPNSSTVIVSVSNDSQDALKRQSGGEDNALKNKEAAASLAEIFEKPTRSAKLKSYCWRLTGTYLWASWVISLFDGGALIRRAESMLFESVVGVLLAIGFAPVNSEYLPVVFKVFWVAAVTVLNPVEMLGGVVYVFGFPLWMILYFVLLFYYKASSESGGQVASKKKVESKEKRELFRHKRRSRFKALVFFVFLLFAWFLLYGGTSSKGPAVLGASISCLVFLLFALRVFSMAMLPVEEVTAPHRWLRKIGLQGVRLARSGLIKEGKSAVESESQRKTALGLCRFALWFSRQICFLIKIKLTKEHVSGVVLLDYIFSLIFVAASAALFWALVVKSLILSMPIAECMKLSVLYFLPGWQPSDVSESLPLWVKFGSSLTAWILFVLFIGPVGEVLPDRQRNTRDRFSQTYKIFRGYVKLLKQSKKELEKAATLQEVDI